MTTDNSLSLQPSHSGVIAVEPHATNPHQQAVVLYLSRYAEGCSRSSVQSGLTQIARLAAALAGVDPTRVDAFNFNWGALRAAQTGALARKVIETYAPRSCTKFLALLRGVLRACHRTRDEAGNRLITADDLQDALDLPRVRGKRPPAGRRLKPDEVLALFAAASQAGSARAEKHKSSAPKRARDRALLTVAYCMGLRRFEIAGLRIADYNRQDGVLVVRGKGNKTVAMELPAGVGAELDSWLRFRKGIPSDPLFTHLNAGGKPAGALSNSGVACVIRDLAFRARVGRVTPHDMRRTCGRRIYQTKGLLAAKDWLRHESAAATTALYADEAEEERAQAAEVMGVPDQLGEKKP